MGDGDGDEDVDRDGDRDGDGDGDSWGWTLLLPRYFWLKWVLIVFWLAMFSR